MNITGSLYKKNNIWHMIIRIPDANGKPRQQSKTTHIRAVCDTKAEERKNKMRAEVILENEIAMLRDKHAVFSNDLFVTRIEKWLEHMKDSVRLDTIEAYQSYFENHIRPYFEPQKKKLKDIMPQDIQSYIDEKYAGGTGLKTDSIKKHLVVLNGVFKEALRFREVDFNPCKHVKLPRSTPYEGKIYTAEETNALIEAAKGDPVEPAVQLGFRLGLRRSEIMGLKWENVDLKHSQLHICNTIVRVKTECELHETKSPKSNRVLAISPVLNNYLQQLKQTQEHNKQTVPNYVDTGYVFQRPDGKRYSTGYISKRFQKVIQKSGLSVIPFHSTRRTNATLLASSGVPPKNLQGLLGHEKASTTMDIYAKILSSGVRDAAIKMDEILG